MAAGTLDNIWGHFMKRFFLILIALVIGAALCGAAYVAVSPYHIKLRESLQDPARRQEAIAQSIDLEKTRWRAMRGDKFAQYRLGRHFSSGDLGFKSLKEAIKWYRKAAEHDHPAACATMAMYYFLGEGVPKDEEAGARELQRAAGGGIGAADDIIGVLDIGGIGVPQDLQGGVDLLKKAHGSDPIQIGMDMQQKLAEVYALPREQRDAKLAEVSAAAKSDIRARLPKLLADLRGALDSLAAQPDPVEPLAAAK